MAAMNRNENNVKCECIVEFYALQWRAVDHQADTIHSVCYVHIDNRFDSLAHTHTSTLPSA